MKKRGFSWSSIFNPKVTPEVTASLDRTNVENIFHFSRVICIFEAVIFATFVIPALVNGTFDRSTLISSLSVIYCIVVCAVAAFIAGRIRKTGSASHESIVLLTVLYYIFMTVWAILVSLRHYRAGNDQLTTFFTVVLCFVCFIAFRPAVSLLLTFATYAALYAVFWSVDRGSAVDIYNFVVLMLVTATCFIVRYRQQFQAAEAHLDLKENYDELQYISRHDALTGARNRTSLEEDMPTYRNVPLTLVMTDIDYFKQFNDRYGHTVGDTVLADACRFFQECFPDCTIYRYGGDEFLLFLNGIRPEEVERTCRSNPGFPKAIGSESVTIRIGFGISSGVAKDDAELTRLIAEADLRLYEMKRETHKNDDLTGAARP